MLKEYSDIETKKDYINWYTTGLEDLEEDEVNYFVEKANFLIDWAFQNNVNNYEELKNIRDNNFKKGSFEYNSKARKDAFNELMQLGIIER